MTNDGQRLAYEEGLRVGFRDGFERGRHVGYDQGRRDAASLAGLAPGAPSGPSMAPVPAPGAGARPAWQPPVAPLTPAQLEDARQRSATRNLNALLYVASFLLVGAAAALLAGSLPDGAKLVGVWALAGLFFGAGLVLAATMPRLRAAGVAVTWTGLGIVPFGGAALASYADVSERVAWLVASGVALAGLVVALPVLRQAAVAYLSVVSLFSTVVSFGAALDLPGLWLLVACVVVALAAAIAGRGLPTGSDLLTLYRTPTDVVTWAVAPLAVVLALPRPAGDLAVVATAASLQYGVSWLLERNGRRLVGARLLLTIALLAAVAALVPAGEPSRALLASVVGLIVVASSTWLLSRPRRDLTAPAPARLTDPDLVLEQIVLGIGLVVMAAAPWLVSPRPASPVWPVVAALLTLAATAAAIVLRSLVLAVLAALTTVALPLAVAAATGGTWEPVADAVVGVLVVALLVSGRRVVSVGWVRLASVTAVAHFGVSIVVQQHAPLVRIALAVVALAGIVVIAEVVRAPWLRVVAMLPAWVAVHQTTLQLQVESPWQTLVPTVAVLAVGLGWLAYDRLRPTTQPLTIALSVATAVASGALSWLVLPGSANPGRPFAALALIGATLLVAVLVVTTSDLRRPGYAGLLVLVVIAAVTAGVTMDVVVAAVAPLVVAGVACVVVAVHPSTPATYGWWAGAATVSQIMGVFVMAALLRVGTEPAALAYAHVAAALILAATLLRARHRDGLCAAAAALPTVVVALLALDIGGWYSVVFLVEQLAVLVLGALLSRRWALWWGIITSTLAVVYFLRDYLFLELSLLALLLIGIVVWRLLRPASATSVPQAPSLPPHAAPQLPPTPYRQGPGSQRVPGPPQPRDPDD